MALNEQTRERIESYIQGNDVVLFMKGNRAMPQCGFSGKVVQILDSLVQDYATVDVLADRRHPRGHQGILGVADDPAALSEGRVRRRLRRRHRAVRHRRAARTARSRGAGAQDPDGAHLRRRRGAHPRVHSQRSPGQGAEAVDRRALQASLGLAPRQEHEVEVEANGIRVLMDYSSAERADGVTIDLVESATGAAFKIDNPNAPAEVKQLSAARGEAAARRAAPSSSSSTCARPRSAPPPSIDGTRLLDQATAAEIERLPKDTMLVLPLPSRRPQPGGGGALPQPRLHQRAQPGGRHRRLVARGGPERAALLSAA